MSTSYRSAISIQSVSCQLGALARTAPIAAINAYLLGGRWASACLTKARPRVTAARSQRARSCSARQSNRPSAAVRVSRQVITSAAAASAAAAYAMQMISDTPGEKYPGARAGGRALEREFALALALPKDDASTNALRAFVGMSNAIRPTRTLVAGVTIPRAVWFTSLKVLMLLAALLAGSPVPLLAARVRVVAAVPPGGALDLEPCLYYAGLCLGGPPGARRAACLQGAQMRSASNVAQADTARELPSSARHYPYRGHRIKRCRPWTRHPLAMDRSLSRKTA